MKIKIIKTVIIIGWAALAYVPVLAQANYSQREDVRQFVDEMVKKHKFDQKELLQRFESAKRLDGVLESIAKPAERTLTWKQYRPIFLNSKRIKLGAEFLKENYELLGRAEKEFGVPAHIIAAIIGVETYYGRRSGKIAVFDSLTTLGFDYPPRSKFFKSELEQLLLLAREESIDVTQVRGSYAGAMGMPQFISSSYRNYAIDFDGDGKRDLWNSKADVIGSVANYFKRHGWQVGESVVHRARVRKPVENPGRDQLKPHTSIVEFKNKGITAENTLPNDAMATLLYLKGKRGNEYWLGLKNFYVITRYNHSSLYAMAVYQLSQELLATKSKW